MHSAPSIDPRIEQLKSTTFLGKRLTRRQIADIQETVGLFPKLSRTELGHTICEHLGWQTPNGSNRIQLARGVLAELERLGILTLPPKQNPGRGPQKPVPSSARSDPQAPIEGPLAALRPLRLEPVREPSAVAEWNEWVQRYHYLGYRQPIGAHLRYFLRDRQGRLLGCLLFDFAARDLACRDQRIGWQGPAHRKPLERVVRNSRYLLLPWVQVKNLASHVLGLTLRQLPEDWQQRHGSRPVLVESYVDPQLHRGSCYRASNWERVGQTRGRKAKGDQPAKAPKDVYLYPLRPDWQQVLRGTPSSVSRPRPAQPESKPRPQPDERFTAMWQQILEAVVQVANEHDAVWMRRRRVLNTLLVVLFVFRLVFAPNRQGYGPTLRELWEQCRALDIPLPQPAPVSQAAMHAARHKVHDELFVRIHRAILRHTPQDDPRTLWRGHRAFAVDGSKLTLPRPLLEDGYRLPHAGSHYPQGLLSCLFRLRSRLPVDFDLAAHGDERRLALTHLHALAPAAVVVYDRGYYSFRLLHAHRARGLHAVFRLKADANTVFEQFRRSDRDDGLLTVLPSDSARRQQPETGFQPCRVRLVRYTAGDTEYLLATTLLDSRRYPRQALADLYHARWGVEELYKVSQTMLQVEQFHGQSERLVRQELSAHFSLVAMTRLFTNQSAAAFRSAAGKEPLQANFRNGLRTVGRHLEGLFLAYAATLSETVSSILASVATCRQRKRSNRSYPRLSHRPVSQWRSRKPAPAPTSA